MGKVTPVTEQYQHFVRELGNATMPSDEKSGTAAIQVRQGTPGAPLVPVLETNPNLYVIVTVRVNRNCGPMCETSSANEPKTRKPQIQ